MVWFKKTFLLLFVLLSCASHIQKDQAKIEINDIAVKNEINNSLAYIYPDKFKAIHHVIFKQKKKSYVLNGYLKVDRQDGRIFLIAQNEFGGNLFELFYIQGKEHQINVQLEMLEKEWLEKSVLEDLKNLYLNIPLKTSQIFKDNNNNLILFNKLDSKTREYVFNIIDKEKNLFQLKKIKDFSSSGKSVYSIEFYYDKENIVSYPKLIFIKNNNMNYSLKINVQYIAYSEQDM